MKTLVVWSALLFVAGVCLAQSNSTTNSGSDDIDWARHVVQAYEDYHRQQEQTFSAIEQARQDAVTATATARRNAEEMEARLHRIEESLSLQRQREMENLQQTQHSTLMIVGGVAAVGLVCMLILALLLLRSMNRRIEAVIAPLTGATLRVGPAFAGQLGTGEAEMMTLNPAEQSSARFISAIERLEKRIAEMEGDVLVTPSTNGENGHTNGAAEPLAEEEPVLDEQAAQVAALLGKGQTLLNMDRFDEALACFDEALANEPKHAEALVKKGTALEKLGKLDEAIQCYDQAIEADNNLTLAYLCKGGVFNRLEKYNEALACYEQALRTKEKANVA